MTNQNSSYPILCASFNQDYSCFAVGTKLGFKIFDAETLRLCYQKDIGAFGIVEMRFSSSLLAIVGAGEQPALSPRRLCLFNTTTGAPLQELNFLTSVLAIRLNKLRLIVLLQDKVFIYDINSLAILSVLDTVPNPKGLSAFSHILDACFLALPASTTKGSMLVYDVMELQSLCEIDAHLSPLAAMVFSSNGTYLATASEQGTMVRVHTVPEGTKCFSFRRGAYPSTIFSLSFGSFVQLPEFLAAISSSGSLHLFILGAASNQRGKNSSSFIGGMIPSSILDPAHHHVLHNAVVEGVKSYAVIRKVEKISDASGSGTFCFRATVSVVTYDGYFREYIFNINHKNESSWTLEREYNLLTAISDITTRS
ncbi:autophagy-related protein 18b-like isoform X2 [Chenopodium quinoa]|uniref:autophagy-related protein 18b-like isoform X2 n=1 Tax=Chenopodium quinoa TaxID=63459 RepID=UPI000B79140B|nr:autophagy-related protein 18b-like isoform X2 [Chenopodium quinoa]